MDGLCIRDARKYDLSQCFILSSELRISMIDMKFVLLHDAKGDDGVKSFFMDVWELYIKVSDDPNGRAKTTSDGKFRQQ